jgi:four helix bundle protein
MRRSSQSIPTNIAESCGRNSDPDFARFLTIAMGSASELEYQLLLAHDLQLIEKISHEKQKSALIEVKKMLYTLIIKVKPSN